MLNIEKLLSECIRVYNINKDLLSYMTDRKSSKKPLRHVKDFLKRSYLIQELRDEAYVQIQKQISSHPNYDKMIRGWNIFAIVASTFPPSERLFFSLINFLYITITTNKDNEIIRHANYIMARLNRIFSDGARSSIPCDKEILYTEV
jgi:hypothetical protein